ncbi:hypothetical protein [Fischerella thermalis]|uniref:Uncharacterized protein n=1 Tax=Fischerella thermalis CCMEE 5318 TaxID=2019666 RepID=A0A2N6LN95_9CYAN|nr:hypothetical protein [Fischerella thermalis]PMB26917.1 hypothetical protein CEN46_02565 [Fischerella thermalis CCMEE 5318]PMB38428.1 hypothetical protein CEN47_06565 [Fischerella thermalis CCMEE 5319]
MYGKKTDNISDSSTTRKPFARGENIENAIATLLEANAKLPKSRCQKSISKTVAIMSSALGKAKYIQIDNLKYFAIIYEIKKARQGENKPKVKNIQGFDF